jgi:hypothetical protein
MRSVLSEKEPIAERKSRLEIGRIARKMEEALRIFGI